MSRSVAVVRSLALGAVLLAGAGLAQAQGTPRPKTTPHRAPVCARGVRVYTDSTQIPARHDTLSVPAPDGPVRVTNEQEMEAAELAMRGRAGSVGATGVLVIDDVTTDADGQRVRRRVVGLYVPADSARAQQACK